MWHLLLKESRGVTRSHKKMIVMPGAAPVGCSRASSYFTINQYPIEHFSNKREQVSLVAPAPKQIAGCDPLPQKNDRHARSCFKGPQSGIFVFHNQYPIEPFNNKREQVSLAAPAPKQIAGCDPLPQKMTIMPGAAP